ncbi:MAG TPA: hypothetical protein VK188_03590 [Holophaga sp.]|nr:hypothetical protein [Holophaga sp.]
MRFPLAVAALAAALPLGAAGGSWYFGASSAGPRLEGSYLGIQDGKPVDFDLVKDLALGKDGSGGGFLLEYQGPRFGLELAMETQKYKGLNQITRDITISGQDFPAQATVSSRVKATATTFNWTVRLVKAPGFWFGVDLGVRSTYVDAQAHGVNYLSGEQGDAVFKSPLPMPQVGPSMGYASGDGRFAIRGYYHYLGYKGATYHHAGGDVRFFPLAWLGVRAYVASESWKVPNGSLKDDLEITLDRSGAGFGVLVKF